MNQVQLRKLEAAVLKSPSMLDRTSRDVIVNGLSPSSQERIERLENDPADAANIFQACVSQQNGLPELLAMMEHLEGKSPSIQQIWTILEQSNQPDGSLFGNMLFIAGLWLVLVFYAILSGGVFLSTGEMFLALSPSLAIFLFILISIFGKESSPEESSADE